MKKFLHFLFALSLLNNFNVLAQTKPVSPCKLKRAAIYVGASDVKGFVYCLDDGKSVPTSDPIRAPARTGIADGLQDGVIQIDQISVIAKLTISVWNQIKDIKGKWGIQEADIRVVLSSAAEETRNVDGLIERLSFEIPHKQIALVSAHEEAAFGLLDALNFASNVPDEKCMLASEIDKSIFINIGSGNTNIAYFDRGEFKTIEINIGGAGLLRLSNGQNKEAIRRVLDSKLDRANLLQTHRVLFDKVKRPQLFLTGGTVWATSRIVAATSVGTDDDLHKQAYSTSKQCYMRLYANSFSKSIATLERLRSEQELLARYRSFYTKVLSPILSSPIENQYWSTADRERDVDNLLAAYGYKQDELIAQSILADWLLEQLDRRECDEDQRTACQFLYMNQQDNWGRIYEYRDVLVGKLNSQQEKVIGSVKGYGGVKPKISFRSRDMLR